MISVDLVTTESGGGTTKVGWIDFYALPVQYEADFTVVPPGLVSFDEVQAISVELSQQGTQGRVAHYQWRKSS